MRIAAISDIHGNIYSLMRVLEDIDSQKIDKIVCLGDFVGYGPHPNEVVALIKRRDIPCIKGNYDASVVDGDYTYIRNTEINSFALPWTCSELRESHKYYLDSLPTFLKYDINGVSLHFTHGSPEKINEYLFEDADNTKKIMESLESDMLICGHTHIPYAKQYGDKVIVNVGSVGKPKNGRPNCTYTIIDIDEKGHVTTILRELSYDYKKIVKDCAMLHFPASIVNSYETGLE